MRARINRVWWDTTRLVETASLDAGVDISGAIVKVRRRVTRGDVGTDPTIADRAMATGAVAAVVATIVEDHARKNTVGDYRDAARAVVSSLTTGRARALALDRMDEIMGWCESVEPVSS